MISFLRLTISQILLFPDICKAKLNLVIFNTCFFHKTLFVKCKYIFIVKFIKI